MKRLLLLVLVAGCSSSPDRAPSRSELETVLDRVHARLRDAGAVTVEAVTQVNDGPKCFLRTTWAKPGVYREERWDSETPEGEASSLEVSDGTTQWLWQPETKAYYKREIEPADLERKPFVMGFTRDGSCWVAGIEPGREEELNFGAGFLCMPIKGGGALALEADEETGGRACNVVSYRVGALTQKYWVAKDDATPVRFKLESSFEHNGRKFLTSAEATLKRLDTAPVDAGLFSFTPPAGAKRASLGEEKLLAVGTVAPEMKVVDLAGKPVKLADFRGRVVFLNFWYTG